MTLNTWTQKYEKENPEFVAEGLATETIEEVLAHLKGEKTQQWLADKMGVHRQQVSRWLNAPTNLTYLSAARMAVALGLKPRFLLNSEAYYIRRYTDNPNFEEFQSDKRVQQGRVLFTNQNANNVMGGITSGTA